MRSCEDCKQWLYGLDGKIKQRLGKDLRRPPEVGTPCSECPKKNPTHAKTVELSEKNLHAIQTYWKSQAMDGRCFNDRERRDPILMRNMAVIHRIFEDHKADQQSKNLVQLFTAVTALGVR